MNERAEKLIRELEYVKARWGWASDPASDLEECDDPGWRARCLAELTAARQALADAIENGAGGDEPASADRANTAVPCGPRHTECITPGVHEPHECRYAAVPDYAAQVDRLIALARRAQVYDDFYTVERQLVCKADLEHARRNLLAVLIGQRDLIDTLREKLTT